VHAARRTIRFVFRDYPDIVRKASSDYLRSVKRNSRGRPSDVSTITGTEDTQEATTPEKEVG
jgi:hypothetical protein